MERVQTCLNMIGMDDMRPSEWLTNTYFRFNFSSAETKLSIWRTCVNVATSIQPVDRTISVLHAESFTRLSVVSVRVIAI